MKEIVLEILRDGPPHNQLLSPLTKYLALCGDHPAAPLQIGVEHAQWLARVSGLSYRESDELRSLQLQDIAATMASILEQVPGLVAELARCREAFRTSLGAKAETVHLRLILNASELAFLPFELANAPAGSPSAGSKLVLQSEIPLSVTRETRRPWSADSRQTTDKPKVLFAFASPGAPVPHEAHLLALRRAIDPWVGYAAEGDAAAARARVEEHLRVIPYASLRSISDACATGKYSHIHLLAHGISFQQGDEKRFGLALHNDSNPAKLEIVEGSRLASAVRCHQRNDPCTLAAPFLVSLASCDSGNVGGVIGPSASIAHDLHTHGVPLVVASQFPLTIPGSVHWVRVLFEGMLWGVNPLCVLADLRRQLHAEVPEGHDWASLVAYASLQPDNTACTGEFAFEQARRSISVALEWTDCVVRGQSERYQSGSQKASDQGSSQRKGVRDPIAEIFARPFAKLEEATRRVERMIETPAAGGSRRHGLLGALDKRRAELYLEATQESARQNALEEEQRVANIAKARGFLEMALDHYRAAFRASRDECWAEVQSLALELALGHKHDDLWCDRWTVARVLSETDLTHLEVRRRAWALQNLVELHVLAAAVSKLRPDEVTRADPAGKNAEALVALQGKRSLEVRSLRRQLHRYLRWFDTKAFDCAMDQEEKSRLYKEATRLFDMMAE